MSQPVSQSVSGTVWSRRYSHPYARRGGRDLRRVGVEREERESFQGSVMCCASLLLSPPSEKWMGGRRRVTCLSSPAAHALILATQLLRGNRSTRHQAGFFHGVKSFKVDARRRGKQKEKPLNNTHSDTFDALRRRHFSHLLMQPNNNWSVGSRP